MSSPNAENRASTLLRHRFTTAMTLPVPQREVFAFFSDAANLERITPPELHFKILTPMPIALAAGALIDYRLGLFGFSFQWSTEISVWDPPHRFVDTQLRGPYKEWVHTHQFRQTGSSTEILDDVRYRLPFSPLGEIAYPLVRLQISRIFSYRGAVLRKLLGAKAAGDHRS